MLQEIFVWAVEQKQDLICGNVCVCRHFDTVGIEKSAESAAQLFSVPDFVGDACKAIASRVRGAVASVQFDDFHKVSGFTQAVFIATSVHISQMTTCGFSIS